mgnify:CR=1 FL=1
MQAAPATRGALPLRVPHARGEAWLTGAGSGSTAGASGFRRAGRSALLVRDAGLESGYQSRCPSEMVHHAAQRAVLRGTSRTGAGGLGDSGSHLIHEEGLQAQEPPHGLLDDPGHFAAFRATVIFQGGVGRRGEVDRTPSSLASLPRHQSVSRCSAKRRRRRRTARDHGCRRMDVLRRLRAPIDVYRRFIRSVYRRLLTARNVPGCYELRSHSSSERWRASWRGG